MSVNAEKKSLEKASGGPNIEPVSEGNSAALHAVDKAYQFAKEHHAGPLSEADNRRILKKIDRHLLPLVRPPLSCWCPCLMHVPVCLKTASLHAQSTTGRVWVETSARCVLTARWPDDHHLYAQLQ